MHSYGARALCVFALLVVAVNCAAQGRESTIGLYLDPEYTQSVGTANETTTLTVYVAVTELESYWDTLRVGYARYQLVPSQGIESIVSVGATYDLDNDPAPLLYNLFWNSCGSPDNQTFLIDVLEVTVTPQSLEERIDITVMTEPEPELGTCVPSGNFTILLDAVPLRIMNPVNTNVSSWSRLKAQIYSNN